MQADVVVVVSGPRWGAGGEGARRSNAAEAIRWRKQLSSCILCCMCKGSATLLAGVQDQACRQTGPEAPH